MWLVAHALSQTLKLGLVKVLLQDWLVHLVGAFVDDDTCPFPGTQAAHVCQAAFGYYHVEIVLRLVHCNLLVIRHYYTPCKCGGGHLPCVHMGTIQLTPWGSVLDGRVEGVCMMLYFDERRKSAEPPKPFSMREPITQVELACA